MALLRSTVSTSFAAPAAPRTRAARRVAAAPVRAAADGDAVDAAVGGLIDGVKAAGAALKAGVQLAGEGVRAAQQGYEAASPYIERGVEAVAPAVQEAAKVANEVAAPVLKKAVPIVQDTLTGAVKSSGVDIDTLAKTAAAATKTAADGAQAATPYLQQAWQFVSTSEPAALAQYGAAAVGAYLLAPALLGGLAGGLRGYAGDINAVQALEALDGGAVIVDIRSAREKENAGVPDVPGGASKLVEVEFATIEDRKLRGSLRDAGALEAQVTALQVANLKRLGKGTKVLLLDRNGGGAAKTVARALARRGFGRAFVIEGGFEGRGGWVQSKLLVKPVASAGGFSPSPLPNLARTISSRRALPAPSK